MICPDDHKHAETGTCYVIHKCRCGNCRTAIAERAQRRNRLKMYGRYDNGLVDAAPVREHVEYLQAFGYGWKRIAELSGVGNTAISQLIYGRKGSNSDPRKGEQLKRVSRTKADRILAVKPNIDTLAGGALVPARGTARRVQALVACGWSQSKLAGMLGMELSNFGKMLHRDQVTAATHRSVAELFDQLWDQQPPKAERHDSSAFTRSIRYAKARRWLPPLAWDDIDNDVEPPLPDEEAGLDEIAIELAMSGEPVRLSHAERRAALAALCALKLSDGEISRRLRIADRTVLRIRQELGIAASVGADGQVVAA